MRRHKVNEINLAIDEISPYSNSNYEGFVIRWVSDIGFGEYTIFKKRGTNEWCADAETMDTNEDKDFIKELMRLFIEQITVL